ncbi:MAG: aminoacyl-tRNA hydrolase [Verrucomicrobiaceae bacterium]|nr:MAG: aminoacyl-tRNA hydrolase [Verrucomicrobiaceae bacterium]
MTDTPRPEELKMWLVIRTDLTLTQGKFGAQVGHAFGRLYLHAARTVPALLSTYLADNEPKITVRVSSEAEMLRVEQEAQGAGIPCQLIRDAGRSEIEAGTITVCAFGPALRSGLPSFLKRLQLLKEPKEATPNYPQGASIRPKTDSRAGFVQLSWRLIENQHRHEVFVRARGEEHPVTLPENDAAFSLLSRGVADLDPIGRFVGEPFRILAQGGRRGERMVREEHALELCLHLDRMRIRGRGCCDDANDIRSMIVELFDY